jgi:tetratricopeptide (TPR) repeat protein
MSSPPGLPRSKTELLRAGVSAAGDDASRLAALLALARHFAETSDGVNGLETARAARKLAMQRGDWEAVAHALNSASVSQYHRSDYVNALATAIDAWDAGRRSSSAHSTAESFYTIGLALQALGEVDLGQRIADKGLELAESDPALREPRVRLVGLKAMFNFARGNLAETERYCAEAVRLSVGHPQLIELGLGNWGFALLRTAEQRIERGESPLDYLARAREHFATALDIADTEGDVMRVADRLSGLGQVALLEGRLDDAERLLADAMRRSIALDYVRTTVLSARYLAQLYLAGGATDRAIDVLRLADAQARRGAPGDSLPRVRHMLADALEAAGQGAEAAQLRESANELREANRAHRETAAEEARRLAARVLGSP